MTMTTISDLAAKYARQRDNVNDLLKTADLAKANYLSEYKEMEVTEKSLKDLISPHKPKVLIPIGSKRHVLVHCTNGSFGNYSSIDIVEETQ